MGGWWHKGIKEGGAAANLKTQGYEPRRLPLVICECYSRELRGCASSFFRALSLRWCGVHAPPHHSSFLRMLKRDVAGNPFVNFTLLVMYAVKMFQIIVVLSRCGIIM